MILTEDECFAALEALQAEVVRLRVIAKEASEYATKHQTEVLRLQAQLAAAHGQEPVGYLSGPEGDLGFTWKKFCDLDTPLYAAPLPQQPAPSAQPSQEWKPALSPATISTAPACLNTNDKAMWVLGWNECLNAQPAQVPGWIPVGERLPEVDSGEVLVWLTGGRCAFDEWHQYHEDPTGLGGGTLYMGDMWRDYEFDEITHWMPLPAAPDHLPEAGNMVQQPARVPPSQALSLDLLERLSKTLTRLGYATPEGGMEHFNADLANQLYNLCRAVDSLFDREQPPAPSDTAITYMTGCSDGKEWAQTSQAVVVEPVYQYQLANGNWIDQTKESYDYNVKHGQATVRMLYATPQAAPLYAAIKQGGQNG